MSTLNDKNIEKICFYVLLGITVLWFFFFINKGVDVTDSAFYLVKYKYGFMENMDVVNTGTFLTDLLGTGIYHLCDKGQVFLLNLSSWLLYMGSGFIVYHRLKKYVPRLLLLISIFGGSLFSLTWVHVMNYNATSMFMQTLAICILIKGIEQENIRYYALSGFVFALNTFFRLPNILQVCIGASIFWYFSFCKKEWKKGFYGIVSYGVGVMSGWLLGGVFAFSILGKEKIFAYFFQTANTFGDSQSNHGIKKMLTALYIYAKQGVKDWIRYGVLLVIVLVIWNLIIRKKERLSGKERILYFTLAIGLALYSFYVGWRMEFVQFPQMIGPCILGIMFVGVFYYKNTNALLSTMCAIIVCAEAVLCIGTNNSWYYQTVFLIFPLCVCIIGVYNCQNIYLKRNLVLCTVFVAAMLFAVGGKYATSFVYRDAEMAELKFPVSVKEYRGIQTSRERAEYLNELDEVLEDLEGQELLSFGRFNIGHVIADMPPILGRVWVDLEGYSVYTFEEELESAVEKKGYPVILIADLEQDGQYTSKEKLDVINKMLQEGDYTKYYENEWYYVYVPEK